MDCQEEICIDANLQAEGRALTSSHSGPIALKFRLLPWNKWPSYCEILCVQSYLWTLPSLKRIYPSRRSSYQPAKPIDPVFNMFLVDHLNFVELYFNNWKFTFLFLFFTILYDGKKHFDFVWTNILHRSQCIVKRKRWICCSHWVFHTFLLIAAKPRISSK